MVIGVTYCVYDPNTSIVDVCNKIFSPGPSEAISISIPTITGGGSYPALAGKFHADFYYNQNSFKVYGFTGCATFMGDSALLWTTYQYSFYNLVQCLNKGGKWIGSCTSYCGNYRPTSRSMWRILLQHNQLANE